MARNEAGEGRAFIGLVEQVAADDQIVLAAHDANRRHACPIRRQVRHGPVTVPVLHRRQIVQTQVLLEKALRQRMAIAGGDVGAPAMADEARQREPATNLQNPLAAGYRPERDARRELRTGRPQQAEQRPRRGGDAQALRFPERIEELPTIGERADDEIVDAGDGDAVLPGPVAGHAVDAKSARRAPKRR